MQSKILTIILILSFVFISCNSNSVFDSYKTVPNKWDKDSIVSFKVNPPDTINPYNLFVTLRNNSNYKYSNLFLIVGINFPKGKIIKDTLEYQMAEPNGKFLGTGFSDIKENKLWYKENVIFSESGEYIVNIQHAMRENGKVNGVKQLEGVTDVGFKIENVPTN